MSELKIEGAHHAHIGAKVYDANGRAIGLVINAVEVQSQGDGRIYGLTIRLASWVRIEGEEPGAMRKEGEA